MHQVSCLTLEYSFHCEHARLTEFSALTMYLQHKLKLIVLHQPISITQFHLCGYVALCTGSTASTSCIEAIIVSEQQVGVGAGALKDGYILPPVRIAKTNGERPSPDGGSPRSLEPGSSTAAPQTHGAPSEGDAARTQHMAPCGGLATTVSAQHAAVGSPSGPRGSPRPTSGLAVPLLGSTGLIRAESGRLSRHLSTSCLTRSRSLACMLGVDDVAAGMLL